MTEHFLKVYAELYKTRELATPLPNADQVYNGDKIGFDPNGKFSRTLHYCPEGKPPPRSFRLHKGERAPFWATMFYWFESTGVHPCPPLIIHQGGEGDTIRGDYLDGLPEDWFVHATPSGYMDQKGFGLVCHSLVQHCRVRRGYPKFLYVDRHESHWCSLCLRFLREHHIYMVFLKAHDSTNDQPNDIGNNAQVQCQYKWAVNEWMNRYAGAVEVLSAPYFNRILVTAWNSFLADPRTPDITRRAFEASGLHPMINLLQTGQQLSADQVAKVRDAAHRSSLTVRSDADYACNKMQREIDQTGAMPVVTLRDTPSLHGRFSAASYSKICTVAVHCLHSASR
jgi:hypothetical protein